MEKIKEELCEINYSTSLEELAKATVLLLDQKIREFKVFFDISNSDKIVVNYFDNLEEFREFIYSLRGERKTLPKYSKGTYDNGMVNAYINPTFQLKRLYTASHELFHILYMKYILKNDYSKRIVWYDEGMAQFMSGEKDSLMGDDFKNFYFDVKENTKIIPQINSLNHGDAFVNENYNGYDLSYLSIEYLSEILSTKQFKNLMSDFLKINHLGNDITREMFDYYDEKFKNKNCKK